MKTFGLIIALVLLWVALFLGFVWVVWSVWLLVLPAIWPDGPTYIIDISYGVFLGVWLLLGMIAGLFKNNESARN